MDRKCDSLHVVAEYWTTEGLGMGQKAQAGQVLRWVGGCAGPRGAHPRNRALTPLRANCAPAGWEVARGPLVRDLSGHRKDL